ncbi:hypothetical protein [Pseudomonas denitrificans (nom. rej.)]|uniref:hypothetical protein n=1 Tax=Pseudomonas denitrificans TaxID=43306 RepID=UPI001E2B991F|nr:hypothetical protein [Pseudomonas denitrificans (nom. rej.)]
MLALVEEALEAVVVALSDALLEESSDELLEAEAGGAAAGRRGVGPAARWKARRC